MFSGWSLAWVLTREKVNALTQFLVEMEQVLSRLMLLGIISIYMAKGALPTCMDQFCPAHYQVKIRSYFYCPTQLH